MEGKRGEKGKQTSWEGEGWHWLDAGVLTEHRV